MAAPAFERAEGRVRPRYARLGLLGLGSIALSLTIFAGLVMLMFPDEAAFIVPMWIAAVAATVVVWRFDATWSHIVGAIAALGLAFMMFWIAFGLLYPSSFFDFVPAVLFVLGVALAVFGNIAAIFQRRRQHLDPHAGPTERWVTQVVVGLVIFAVVASAVLTMLSRSNVDEAEAANATPLTMADFTFDPAAIEVDGGGQLVVRNNDPFVHDVAVPALDLDPVTVPPGSSVLIDVPAAQGSYVLYCTLHSDVSDDAPDVDEQMVASLVIR